MEVTVARHTVAEAPTPSHPWKRYAVIGLIVLAIAALVVWLFWPSIQEWMWFGQLHSDDPNVRREARASLAASDREGLDERLRDKLMDDDVAFGVRKQIGKILLRRGRLPLVEQALRADALDARMTGLAVLFDHRHTLPEGGDVWFKREYVEKPAYRVKETLLAWLGREGDLSRIDAISIVGEIRIEEAVPLLRQLVRPTGTGTLSQRERGLVTAAARTLQAFGDCEVMPVLAEVATSSTDERVRLRMTQVLHQAVRGPRAPCADAVPVETVKSLVVAGLDGPPVLRQAVLGILGNEREWLVEVRERVRGILDGAEGDNPYVRRAALGALASLQDESFLRLLPRYFHSDERNVRSAAVSASRGLSEAKVDELHLASCWVGLVYDERENDVAFDAALGGLSQLAGKWIGVPESVTADPKTRRELMMRFRKEIFAEGESAGLSRKYWAEAWFKWWAGERGLTDEGEIVKAVAARDAFHEAAQDGRVEDAAAAIAPWTESAPGLFLYEQAWLDLHE
jgi:HEAT repeat protein